MVYSVPGSRPDGRTDHHVMSVGSASRMGVDLTRRCYWEASVLSLAGLWPPESQNRLYFFPTKPKYSTYDGHLVN